METLFKTIQLFVVCGAALSLTFLVLLAMPHSRLRAVVMPVVAWTFAVFCGLFVISPVDIVPEALFGPFGFIDDVGAIIAGYSAIKAAKNARIE